MQQYKALGSVQEMAKALSVSRSGYYRYCGAKASQRQKANEVLVNAIKAIHERSRHT